LRNWTLVVTPTTSAPIKAKPRSINAAFTSVHHR
jgi:hypothetical protein